MPGQPGTINLLKKYGEALVCVRYRYDLQKKQKIKTVELIVEKAPWEYNPKKIPWNKIMPLKIDIAEIQLRKIVKTAGGKWNSHKNAWELPFNKVIGLGLKERIIAQ